MSFKRSCRIVDLSLPVIGICSDDITSGQPDSTSPAVDYLLPEEKSADSHAKRRDGYKGSVPESS